MTRNLKLCPAHKRNCVSSLDDESDKHRTESIPAAKSQQHTYRTIISVLEENSECTIETEDEQYIHAVFRTKWLKFKDDVEFLYNDEKKAFDVRSAARVGHYDFEVNRRRLEKLRSRITEKQQGTGDQ
ncbi:DUF1499 domain-containing protein [Alteribacter natronophilus]|uniref:DUF1499 domain-containing protein n=1 Tax=Alteribacter natronophilus TaxID=2583810 RepID=UPI00110D7981|nr:DUF1499 domain-containing protein [Alteribacter natronophilus]TMW73444.1 DUF1499 domain-containing protein [Alteribacter natronophilus]